MQTMMHCGASAIAIAAAWIAFQMREGVAGMSICRTPSGASAFITAFMIVAGAAMAPA